MNIGVILAGGKGLRFNSKMHKQYLKINGKEMIYYSIFEMRLSKVFDDIVAVVDEEEYNAGYIADKYEIVCIRGGATRNGSIKNALDYVKENYGIDAYVLFHDCDRPFIKHDTFKTFMQLLDKYDAVAMTREIRDSLVTTDGKFVDRRCFNLIQTPEAFRLSVLYDNFDVNSKQTAIINQMPLYAKIYFLQDNSFNFKVIYPEELFLAEQFMRIDYLHANECESVDPSKIGKVLLLGGSGGVGLAIKRKLDSMNIQYFAPSHRELDLYNVGLSDIERVMPFEPDVIINVAAAYANDDVPLLDSFDVIFNVNLRANLVLIEYAKKLNKKVNIVLMGSSSSTRGRENLTNYSAAKAALNSIVESQGHNLAEKGVYINAIIPEKIDTPLIQKLHKVAINKRELLDADEVVNAVLLYASTDAYGKLIHIRKGL